MKNIISNILSRLPKVLGKNYKTNNNLQILFWVREKQYHIHGLKTLIGKISYRFWCVDK